MIKIESRSNDSTIGEYHLCTILYGLEDALDTYKSELKAVNNKPYPALSPEEIHLKKLYESKIHNTEKLVAEIKISIDQYIKVR